MLIITIILIIFTAYNCREADAGFKRVSDLLKERKSDHHILHFYTYLRRASIALGKNSD